MKTVNWIILAGVAIVAWIFLRNKGGTPPASTPVGGVSLVPSLSSWLDRVSGENAAAITETQSANQQLAQAANIVRAGGDTITSLLGGFKSLFGGPKVATVSNPTIPQLTPGNVIPQDNGGDVTVTDLGSYDFTGADASLNDFNYDPNSWNA